MTKESAKIFSDLMTKWLLKAVDIQFKNEDDEYQQMADFFNENMPIDEEKLDKRAEEYALGESDYCGEQCVISDAYKAGYRDGVMEGK